MQTNYRKFYTSSLGKMFFSLGMPALLSVNYIRKKRPENYNYFEVQIDFQVFQEREAILAGFNIGATTQV